jgi:hypothetical protein
MQSITIALLAVCITLMPKLGLTASSPIVAKVEEAITVDGQVVKSPTASFGAALKLQVPIKISNDGDFHDKKVFTEIGIDLGDPNRFPLPQIGLNGTFRVVVRCARFDCMVVEFLPVTSALQAARPQQSTPAATPSTPAFNSPIPIDFSAVTPDMLFFKCQYLVNQANGRVNREGMECVVQNNTRTKIASRSVTYTKYDSQDVRMGPPYTLDSDLFPGEKVQIRLLGIGGATRVVFRRESR